jgi:hypothetical protein
MKFAYQPYLIRGTGTTRYALIHRPVISIRAAGPSGADELMRLVATGADDTLLPGYHCQSLGVVIAPGDRAVIVGIDGGTTEVRYGTVDLDLPGYRWSSRVGFHAGFHTILGHSGFLEHFTASFNGLRRHLTLTPNGTAPPPSGAGV